MYSCDRSDWKFLRSIRLCSAPVFHFSSEMFNPVNHSKTPCCLSTQYVSYDALNMIMTSVRYVN